MEREKDEETFNEIVQLVNYFKHYFIKYYQPVYENPSPGNKDGGITTLEEKSLGCVQKGGFAPVQNILPYGDRVTDKGLNLLQSPGYELIFDKFLAASGCIIFVFITR